MDEEGAFDFPALKLPPAPTTRGERREKEKAVAEHLLKVKQIKFMKDYRAETLRTDEPMTTRVHPPLDSLHSGPVLRMWMDQALKA